MEKGLFHPYNPSGATLIISFFLIFLPSNAHTGGLGHQFHQDNAIDHTRFKQGPVFGHSGCRNSLSFIDINDFVNQLHAIPVGNQAFHTLNRHDLSSQPIEIIMVRVLEIDVDRNKRS